MGGGAAGDTAGAEGWSSCPWLASGGVWALWGGGDPPGRRPSGTEPRDRQPVPARHGGFDTSDIDGVAFGTPSNPAIATYLRSVKVVHPTPYDAADHPNRAIVTHRGGGELVVTRTLHTGPNSTVVRYSEPGKPGTGVIVKFARTNARTIPRNGIDPALIAFAVAAGDGWILLLEEADVVADAGVSDMPR